MESGNEEKSGRNKYDMYICPKNMLHGVRSNTLYQLLDLVFSFVCHMIEAAKDTTLGCCNEFDTQQLLPYYDLTIFTLKVPPA